MAEFNCSQLSRAVILNHAAWPAQTGVLIQSTMLGKVYVNKHSANLITLQAIERLKDAEPLDHMPTPAEIVGARLSMAAAAAGAIANSAASAAASAAAPLAANISSAAVGITAAPMQAVASQLQWAASVGQRYVLENPP